MSEKTQQELLDESLLLNKALNYSLADLYNQYDNLKTQSTILLTALTLKYGPEIVIDDSFLELAKLSYENLRILSEGNNIRLEL